MEPRKITAMKMTNEIIKQYLQLRKPSKSRLELRIDLSILDEGKEHFKNNFDITVKIMAVKQIINEALNELKG